MSGKPYLEQPDLHARAPYRSALLTYPGNLKAALKDAKADRSKTLFGVAHGIPSTFVTKILASARPDFIWIDVEHGIFDRSTLYDSIHAAQHHSEGHSLVVVRVPKHSEVSLTTALDAGASGIVIPHTESAEEVRAKVKEIYYGPIGQRSFSPWTFTPGVSDTSLYPNDSFNVRTSNDHIAVIAQIESVKGLENIEEIAAMPEVDALMFGPGDYSIDAGFELKLGGEPHPGFIEAMTRFVTVAHKYGKPLFGGAQHPSMIPMMIAQGYAGLAVTFDYWGLATLVADGIKTARATVRGEKVETNGVANGANEKQSEMEKAFTVNVKLDGKE